MLLLIVAVVVGLIAVGAGGLLELHLRTGADRRPPARDHANDVFIGEVFIDGEGPFVVVELEPLDDSEPPRRARATRTTVPLVSP